MDKNKNIKASCTWGDGPDVLVVFDGMPFICHEDPKNYPPPRGQWKHGYVSEGSFDLTQDEARKLANELLAAADACESMEDSYNNYIEGAING